jgi:3-oxoadipate enol-lactonase
MPYSQRNGLRIYYEVYGEGPPMVLIHASPFNHWLWMYQIARYSAFYRVIAIDARGYGRSDKPETPYTFGDMTADILGVCEDESVKKAIFAGVSIGSGMSLMIGIDRPDLVEAMILVGGSSAGAKHLPGHYDGYTGPDLVGYQLHHLKTVVSPSFPDTPQGAWVLKVFNETADRMSGRSIGEGIKARFASDMRDQLSLIKVPTLVINGEYDVSFQSGLYTASNIPGAVRTVIPGTGHACNIEDPMAFDEAIINFLTPLGLWRGKSAR